ncbi:Hypothetical predicted protein [Octopus vulgaris]|uniref:Uncharacterized protein n=1 Tax=Octopus vulgaris TaxID=6645 RepID=A0AA36EW89_OCTVU|nr:Hypothetical predicted protein [Octopus vulgaris]
MPQKSNTSDKTLNEDILKELKNINSQLLNLNNKIEESNLLARESKSNEDATRYTDQLVLSGKPTRLRKCFKPILRLFLPDS